MCNTNDSDLPLLSRLIMGFASPCIFSSTGPVLEQAAMTLVSARVMIGRMNLFNESISILCNYRIDDVYIQFQV